ncbi:High_mobility group box domain superfamily [Hexamita inflata]|uniref:High mobility group box domain superfamily n=1 Tax=Hexamita inflata TaxID=28002 RepID=A0AA86RFD8_9EUKA|nr:High mobility group box domain superfamily [Hexamita inflata]
MARKQKPKKPSRPSTAFNEFMSEKSALASHIHGLGEKTKYLNQMWQNASREIKERYERKHQINQANYQAQLKQYYIDNPEEASGASSKDIFIAAYVTKFNAQYNKQLVCSNAICQELERFWDEDCDQEVFDNATVRLTQKQSQNIHDIIQKWRENM